jgi:chromate reductase
MPSDSAREAIINHADDSSPKFRVLAIPGSLRRQSFNRLLLRAARACAPAQLEIELYEELASVPLFDEDVEQETGGGPPPIQQLRRLVAAADGLMIATPEYNQSLPGVLKNAIDWLSRPAPNEVLVDKPVAIIGATGGRWGTRLAQSALRHTLVATEALVLPKPMLFLRDAATLFDESGQLIHPQTRKQLEQVLSSFARWIAVSTSGSPTH